MKWLEIIELQTSGNQKEDVIGALEMLIADLNQDPKSPKVLVYNSYSFDSDNSIHLIHRKSEPKSMGNLLGLHVAASIKEYVWFDKPSYLVPDGRES